MIRLRCGNQLELNLKEAVRYYSRVLNISANATHEEIKQLYNKKVEKCRRTERLTYYVLNISNGTWLKWVSMGPVEEEPSFVESYRMLIKKKKCSECGEFMIPVPGMENYCSPECQAFTATLIQEIVNKYQRVNPTAEEVYSAGLLNTVFELFEVRGGYCQCEHVPFTPQCQNPCGVIRHHIQTCLKTRTEIENFKNEMLRIIERAVQNRPVNSVQANTSQSLNSNPYPTPPPSPNFTATSSNSSSLTNENGSNNFSTATPSRSTSSISSPSSTASSSNSSISQNQTSPKPSSPAPVLDITTSQPTSSEKPNNNSLVDLPTNNSKPNHEFSSEPLPPKNNNSGTVLDYPNNHNNENDKPTLPANENLTTQKQQLIHQIQTELVKSTNLDLDQYSNWKQTIEEISDIKQLQAYQNNLQQYLQSKKNSLTSSSQSQLTSSKTETNHSKFIW
jgi:hypothetical protein